MSKYASLVLLAMLCAGTAIARAAAPPAQDWTQFQTIVAGAKKAMMTDPTAALEGARSAVRSAEAHPESMERRQAIATGLWLEAEALTRTNRIKDAHAVADRAIALASSDNSITKLDGDLSLTLARIADYEGNIALALKNFQKAYDIFVRLGRPRSQSIALQGLGAIYDEAHDFDREVRYYRRASQVYSADPALALTAANNIGFALQHLGRYDEAIKDFQRALAISVTMKSPFLQANIETNLAAVYAKQHRFAEAEAAANHSLKLLGRNDVNGGAPFVWGVKASIEYERGDIDAAAGYLDRAFRGMNLTTTIAPFRDIHEIAYKVYKAKGNLPLAMAHLEAFKRLDDQGRSLAASANLALLGAQFDFATQQLEIEHLKSVQLQRDISLRASQAATQNVIFASALLAGLLVIAWIGYRHLLVRRHRNAISKANIELTNTLAERDIEIARRRETEMRLRVAIETAEQANRAKSHFLANMSHELRTPLNAIIGFSEIMASETFGAIGNAKYKTYAADICTGGRHLLDVLNDILDMARIDAGRISLADSEFRLSDMVCDAMNVTREREQMDGKTLRMLEGELDIRIRADEGRMRQVMQNLLSNAVKFTGPNGVVTVGAELRGDGLRIVVRDDGVGIPADKIGEVMEAFGQAESAYARTHGGVGLGLPIVKALAEMHGGTFEIESSVGVGTAAIIRLPLDRVVRPSSDAAVA